MKPELSNVLIRLHLIEHDLYDAIALLEQMKLTGDQLQLALRVLKHINGAELHMAEIMDMKVWD